MNQATTSRPGRRRGGVRAADFKPGAYLAVNGKLYEVMFVDKKKRRVQLLDAASNEPSWMRFSTIVTGPWTLVRAGRDIEETR